MRIFGRTKRGNREPYPGRCTAAILRQIFFVAAIFHIAGFQALALDPQQPPGRNFDLSHWYLTLPDSGASTVSASKLASGYTNASWFYTGPDGAMVFWAPVTGGTTDNSQNARSELREMLDPSDTGVNWPAAGTHILEAQCKVLQVPSSGCVFIGQIHGYVDNAPVLVLIKYNNGLIETQFRNTTAVSNALFYPMANVALNELITYRIKLVNGLLDVTVNGFTQSINVFQADPTWAKQKFYFKAGAYNQDSSGPSSEGSRVAFYQLNVSHAAAPVAPSITSQPSSLSTNEGAAVAFKVVATGTAPMFFQWRKDSIDLPDATNSTLTLTRAGTNDAGRYNVLVRNDGGAVTSAVATLTLVPPIDPSALAKALNATNLIWTTAGTPPWFPQTNATHDGADAAQSGAIADGKTTSIQTTVTGPGVLGFWWKVSSEPSNDRLLFYIGSSEKARVTGEGDWQWQTFSISSGSQVLKWTYSKNSSKTGGLDRAWLDQVTFIPNNVPTAPAIAIQPTNQNLLAQTTATFSISAIGSATLSYQWQFNGSKLTNGAGVSGATTATLTVANVQPAQAGNYSVIVSNLAGTIASSNALLAVTPVITLAEALDTTNLIWTTSGTPPWAGQTNVTFDGIDAARSGAVADGGSVSLQTTVNGPGVVTFRWKVSSEPSNDRLRFYVNGSEQARISGEVDWEPRTFNLSPGQQVLQWKYSKNSSVTLGQDRGWIDRVEFVSNATATVAFSPAIVPVVPVTINAMGLRRAVVLTWPVVSGQGYRVFFKDSLSATAWNDLNADVWVSDSLAGVEDATGQPQRFYKVTTE